MPMIIKTRNPTIHPRALLNEGFVDILVLGAMHVTRMHSWALGFRFAITVKALASAADSFRIHTTCRQ